MSQIYPKIESSEKVVDSRQMLLDRDDANRTNNSGQTAPANVTPDDIGMTWFNTQDGLMYNLVSVEEDGSNPVWQKMANFNSFNVMNLGVLQEEALFVDLEGPACDAKADMLVLVEHTMLPTENYEITQDGTRVTFLQPIEAGLHLELRWFTKVIIARDGKTFVPNLVDGVLSWENDGGLPNPEPFDFNVAQAGVVTEGNKQVARVQQTGDSAVSSISNAKNDFNTNAANKTTSFDSNYTSKLNSFNTNATQKQAAVDASVAAAAQSETNASNSANIALEAATKASFGNIGDIKYTARADVPNGGAWCDGALYTKAQFPDVYQMLVDGKLQSMTVSEFDSTVSVNGSCGFFGLDTANQRFKVPMLKDVYLKAGQTPSMFGAESLPNIVGVIVDVTGGATFGSSGVFNLTGAYNCGILSGSTGKGGAFSFNASRSSSTYKDGAKVNPDHVVYRAYVVLYSSAAEASEAQAAEFINGLTSKANTDLSNVSSNIDYVVESGFNEKGTQWYKRFKSGFLMQGGQAVTGTNGVVSVTYQKPFSDNKYAITTSKTSSDASSWNEMLSTGRTTTGCTLKLNLTGYEVLLDWIAMGQGA